MTIQIEQEAKKHCMVRALTLNVVKTIIFSFENVIVLLFQFVDEPRKWFRYR